MKIFIQLLLILILVLTCRSSIDWQVCDEHDPLCTLEDYNISYDNALKILKVLELSLTKHSNEFQLYDSSNFLISDFSLDSSIFCTKCEELFGKLQSADIQTFTNLVNNIAVFMCDILGIEPKLLCKGILPPQISNILQEFHKKLFDPKRVCPHMMMCKKDIKRVSIKKTIDQILSDKPQKQRPIPTSANTFQLLQINDPHIDLKYEPGRNIYCDEIVCCRNNNNPKEKEKKFAPAGQWGSLSKCNLPIWTFEQMVKFIKNKLNVELGIWAGDNIGHNLWEQQKYDSLNLTLRMTETLKQLSPLKFISLFGNHDIYPFNLEDFWSDKDQYLINGLADAWQDWIGVDATNQFREKSYYSYYDYSHEVLILVLNTQVCYNMNFYLLTDPTDPGNQLSWLSDQLYQAEKNNQSVWIVGHIPPAGCYTRWGRIYNALADRFEYIIRGQFSAHVHKDTFEIQLGNDNQPVGIVYVPPTAGTYGTHQNLLPSFRVFDIDLDTKIPVNFYQYRLNLTYWNQYPLADSIEWDLAYDMISEYQMQNLWDYNEFLKLSEKIKSDKIINKKFTSNYWCGNWPSNGAQEKIMHCYTIGDPMKQFDCIKSLSLYAQQKALDALSGSWFVEKSS